MRSFGSLKNCILTARRRRPKGNFFSWVQSFVWENVLSLLSGVLLGSQSCSTSNVNFLKLQIDASVIAKPTVFFKYNPDHFIVSLQKLQWPPVAYRKLRG